MKRFLLNKNVQNAVGRELKKYEEIYDNRLSRLEALQYNGIYLNEIVEDSKACEQFAISIQWLVYRSCLLFCYISENVVYYFLSDKNSICAFNNNSLFVCDM